MAEGIVLPGIFLIAALYASVGHGGASGYLAFMAVLGFAPEVMRPSALILNLFVAGISFFTYYRNNHFRFSLLWPFILTSIPMAFLGGTQEIDLKWYKIILGILLIFAVARMLMKPGPDVTDFRQAHVPLSLLIGILLGLFSGLIGIGGGIILSPVIILLRWASLKQTAAVSAAFILVNSFAGLSGFILRNQREELDILPMVLAGLAGGLAGSYLGSYHLREQSLRYALASVLLLASFKLLFL